MSQDGDCLLFFINSMRVWYAHYAPNYVSFEYFSSTQFSFLSVSGNSGWIYTLEEVSGPVKDLAKYHIAKINSFFNPE